MTTLGHHCTHPGLIHTAAFILLYHPKPAFLQQQAHRRKLVYDAIIAALLQIHLASLSSVVGVSVFRVVVTSWRCINFSR